ncbi:uncharacterized DUF497 family protein [Mesorhizobium shonense]|uniref:Uncharacterized DUF497 family protein n=1 Tax=Mesorhizobium shonense TaxID=1209948 RepID=A0ABV2HWU8_9HYPH
MYDMKQDRFDPAKDAANREKHKLPLAFGDRIFEDDNHLIIPSIRETDGEERSGSLRQSCSLAFLSGGANCPASFR